MKNPNVPRPSPRTLRGRQIGDRSTVTPGAQLAPDHTTIIARVMTALAERIRIHGREGF